MIPAFLPKRLALVWLGLVVATAVSFALGADHGSSGPGGRTVGTCVVLSIAFVKIWFIGMDFMELRHAPLVLRGLFAFWIVAVGTTVVVLFVLGQ